MPSTFFSSIATKSFCTLALAIACLAPTAKAEEIEVPLTEEDLVVIKNITQDDDVLAQMLGQSKGAVKGLKAAGKLAKVPGLHPIIIYNSQLLKAYRKALQGANKFKNSEACKALQLREVEIDLEPYTEDSDVRVEFFRNLYNARGCNN